MAPRADLVHPLAREWLAEMPYPFGEDPDVIAVVHCYMREEERKRTTIATLRLQFNPLTATALGLPWWERLLRLTVAPAGWSDVQRRDAIVAALRKLRARPRGVDQEAALTRLVGPGWTLEEYDPANPAGPPPGTVRVHLPVAPSSDLYARAERLLRGIIEAHLDIQMQFAGGMVWDQSLWDQEGWG